MSRGQNSLSKSKGVAMCKERGEVVDTFFARMPVEELDHGAEVDIDVVTERREEVAREKVQWDKAMPQDVVLQDIKRRRSVELMECSYAMQNVELGLWNVSP
ncbi:hypothetical protein NDU88_002316 [Pleurodeles waltl]|uniref:Uncharacterized protein n=1 Tax=Pleurodeles waltl TaxID=8319 RepID=A0AAV7RE56_PLEWA|nr:hypothetical protein NDU88_002316 [Pleurodeles waltl]